MKKEKAKGNFVVIIDADGNAVSSFGWKAKGKDAPDATVPSGHKQVLLEEDDYWFIHDKLHKYKYENGVFTLKPEYQ